MMMVCPVCNQYIPVPKKNQRMCNICNEKARKSIEQEDQNDLYSPVREFRPEVYVTVPFSWLTKFCTHFDFKEPMSDYEREESWKKKLKEQFNIEV